MRFSHKYTLPTTLTKKKVPSDVPKNNKGFVEKSNRPIHSFARRTNFIGRVHGKEVVFVVVF